MVLALEKPRVGFQGETSKQTVSRSECLSTVHMNSSGEPAGRLVSIKTWGLVVITAIDLSRARIPLRNMREVHRPICILLAGGLPLL